MKTKSYGPARTAWLSCQKDRELVMTGGFTIVELLVVIVIIGILAAITIVSYTGISKKAVASALQSDLSNASKQLKLYYVDHGSYPTSFTNNCPYSTTTTPSPDNKYCLKISNDNTYIYTPGVGTSPQAFYMTSSNGSNTYKVANDSAVAQDVTTNGLVLNLDAGVTASYPGTGTTWNDLSGNGKNGTFTSGVSYTNINSGALNFDGTGKVSYTSGGFLPTGDLAKTIIFWFKPNSGMTSSNMAFSYGCSNAEGMSCASQGVGRYIGPWASTSNIGIHLETCQVNGPSTPSPSTNWHLYSAVFNGNNTITFYTDGSNAATVTPSCTINSAAGTGYAVGSGRSGYYNGLVGNIQVYNRALSALEISQSFNTTKARYGL